MAEYQKGKRVDKKLPPTVFEEEEDDDPFLPAEDEDNDRDQKKSRPSRDRSVSRKSPPQAKRRETRANKNGHIVFAHNDVSVTGRLGRDPDMKVFEDGTPFLRVSLAIYQGKERKPCWMTVFFREEVAEMVNDSFVKGDRIRVCGHLAQWEDKNGGLHTEIASDYCEDAPWEERNK